jgi:hypothetical protein
MISHWEICTVCGQPFETGCVVEFMCESCSGRYDWWKRNELSFPPIIQRYDPDSPIPSLKGKNSGQPKALH